MEPGRCPVNVDAMRRSVRRLTNLVQQPQASWYRVIRNDAGPTRVDIYDEIGGSWLFGGVTASDFVAELAQINGDIEVHINSPGGDVFDGLAIYNSLAQRPGNVMTVVDGLAASAASFIAQAGTTRVIAPGAMMMIHDAAGACYGNASDMRDLAELLDKVSDNLASIYADRTGRADGWRDAMRAETWYTADEAVAAGLAHRVAERPAEQALSAVARFDLSVFNRVPDGLRGAATGGVLKEAPVVGEDGCALVLPVASVGDASRQKVTLDAEELAKLATGEGFVDVQAMAELALDRQRHVLLTDKALPIHHTATVDEPWDGPAAVAAMPSDAATLRYCHAWMDSAADDGTAEEKPDGDADDKKSSYKFPHHKAKGGPANLAACRNGLARLDGADIPQGDKAEVRAHLQAHLDDAAKDNADKGDTTNHAGIPGWLHNDTAPFPAWLTDAEEAQ